MDRLANKKPILASVAVGPYANYGNGLIERSTLKLLGLPKSTPSFSVFERIGDELLERINSYDYILVTGCTTLQDDPGHQRCFDEQFQKIKIPKICFAGTFYCEPDDKPSLRIAQMYDLPIGARDPWAASYLQRNGIDCELVGCPTLIDGPDLDSWNVDDDGDVLISSTPPVDWADFGALDGRKRRYLAHDRVSPGEDLLADRIFDRTSLVITGRLHAALPAIARGIPVRFYDQRHWHVDYRSQQYGSIRYSLLEFLGIPLNGSEARTYPAAQMQGLKQNCHTWIHRVIGPESRPASDA
jgi:hypothetical protein